MSERVITFAALIAFIFIASWVGLFILRLVEEWATANGL